MIQAVPALASASPRVMQGLQAMARVLSDYGYRFDATTITDHNWGAFLAPPGVPCSPPDTLPVDLGGGQSICVVQFPSDEEGINTFVSAASTDPGIAAAMQSGAVEDLSRAMLASPSFMRQSSAYYTDDTRLSTFLGIGLVKIAEALGQTPEWTGNGMRIDLAFQQAQGTDGGAGNGNTPAGGATTPTADEGMSVGAMLALGVGLGAAGYGLYKLAMRGPR